MQGPSLTFTDGSVKLLIGRSTATQVALTIEDRSTNFKTSMVLTNDEVHMLAKMIVSL